jgi:hypothetical protein
VRSQTTVSKERVTVGQFFDWSVAVGHLAGSPALGLTRVKPAGDLPPFRDSVSLQLTAADSANLALTYSATNLPPGLSIGSTTGLISGTIANTANTSTPYAVTVTATDTAGHAASQSFHWAVARLGLGNPADQESREGTAVSLQLHATDVPGTPTYSATGLPAGLTISSSTGVISGTVGAAAHGSSPYQVTVTASDSGNTASQSFVWTVTPRVALVNPGAQGNATGDSVSLQLSASSPGGTMNYSATGLPAGLGIGNSTGLISGMVAAGAASATPYTVTVTANDGTSSTSQTFSWTVSNVYIAPVADQSNLDGDAVSLPLTAHYHGTGTLSYSASGLPAGLGINSATGLISGPVAGTADATSPYQVTVTATDGTNSGSQTFNWAVAPRISIDAVDDQANGVGDVVSLPRHRRGQRGHVQPLYGDGDGQRQHGYRQPVVHLGGGARVAEQPGAAAGGGRAGDVAATARAGRRRRHPELERQRAAGGAGHQQHGPDLRHPGRQRGREQRLPDDGDGGRRPPQHEPDVPLDRSLSAVR